MEFAPLLAKDYQAAPAGTDTISFESLLSFARVRIDGKALLKDLELVEDKETQA